MNLATFCCPAATGRTHLSRREPAMHPPAPEGKRQSTGDSFPFSCLRGARVLLFAVLAVLSFTGGAWAQNPSSRPILFVHGWCGSAFDWAPFFGPDALSELLPSSLYPNQNVYLVEYNSVTDTISYWQEGDPAAGSGTTLTPVAEADIPATARFFAINFYDPNPASTNPIDPTNVAAISVLNKAYEVAEVVHHIVAITQVPQANVLTHSMGGLDARAYAENMASAGACYNYASGTPDYSAATCNPGAGSAAWEDDVANIVTLDSVNAGSPLVNSSLRSLLKSFGNTCQTANTTNSAEMSPGNSLLQSLDYAGVELGGASPQILGTPTQALEDYASDVTKSWTGLTGYSDDVVQATSQSITGNVPSIDASATLTDIPLPYLSSTISGTSGCTVSILSAKEPLIHVLSCLGALQPTLQTVANQLIDDTVPWITSWTVTPATLSLGQSVTLQYNVTDLSTYTLARAELWRAPDASGAPGTWQEVAAPQVLSGSGPAAITFTDTPDTAGKFWYSTRVYDSNGNEAVNSTNTEVTVNPLIPTVTTGSATSILTASAALNGSINPNGGATQYLFVYGTDPGLAGASSTGAYNLSAGVSAQAVQVNVTGLTAGQAYYYQLQAWNSTDSSTSPSTGSILSFTTQNAVKVTPTVSVTPGSSNITTLQALSMTISVTGSKGTATGSVTLSGGGYTSSATTLSGGSAIIDIPAGSLATGPDTLSASYTPDATSSSLYNSAAGASSPVTVNSSQPAVMVTPGSLSITALQALSVTVAVTGSNGTPTGSVTLSGGGYTSSVTALSGGSAIIDIPAGSLAAGSDTLSASYIPDATSSTTYSGVTGVSSAVMVGNPQPVVSAWTPAFTGKGGSAFTLTLNGTGFTPSSVMYWGTTALTTAYGSGTQISAQVSSAEIAAAGMTAVSVQASTPGGLISNSFEFEVDSAASGGTPPSFTTVMVTLAPGSTATYPVTLDSEASGVSVTCLNLPLGAACSYSSTNHAVTITTSASTPAGTYEVTVVFTETLPGALTALVLLPILLLPLAFTRKRWAGGHIWMLACVGLTLTIAAGAIGCGGGGGGATTASGNQTHQVTISAVVHLTVE